MNLRPWGPSYAGGSSAAKPIDSKDTVHIFLTKLIKNYLKNEGDEATPLLLNQSPRVALGWAHIVLYPFQMHVRHVHFQGDPPKCNTLTPRHAPFESLR
jgi:hypothetical protein